MRIFNLISTLTASLDYQQVLDNILDLSAQGLSSQDNSLVSAILLPIGNKTCQSELHVMNARCFSVEDERKPLPGASGVLARVIGKGEHRFILAPFEDPELSLFNSLSACRSAYCIPLLDGVLLFAHPEQDYFNRDRLEILDIFGEQAAVALRNARLYRELEQKQVRMMDIQEAARKRLARDLHDGPVQSVAALVMRVNIARRLMERDAEEAVDELVKAEDLARQTTKEMRQMLFSLRPLVLESQGLAAALHSLADLMCECYDQNVAVDVDEGILCRLDEQKQGMIFYITEQAVDVIRRRGSAANIGICLQPAGDGLALLEIQGDGGVVDQEPGPQEDSLDVLNIRERAELLNAAFLMDFTPERGVSFRLQIPLTEQASGGLRLG